MNKYKEALDLKFEKSHIIDLQLDKFPEAQMALYDNEELKQNINKTEEFSNKHNQDTTDTLLEAVNKANKYDEKTTPKKPIRKRIYYNCRNGECDKSFIYYCPVCNFNSVEKDYANFCPNCGQKLNWDDEDE